jgi:hypothetical protein
MAPVGSRLMRARRREPARHCKNSSGIEAIAMTQQVDSVVPRANRRGIFDPWLLAALLALTLPLALFVFNSTMNVDEMTLLYNAQRLYHGEVMYRDFFEFLPPLPDMLAAGVFMVTGPSVLAARLAQLALMVLTGACIYDLARKRGLPPLPAILPIVVLVLSVFPVFTGYSHHWLALCFSMVAIWALQVSFSRPSVGCGFVAGFCAALTCLSTQPDGAALMPGLLVGLCYFGRNPSLHRIVAAFCLGLFLPLVVCTAWLGALGTMGDAINQVILWPFQHYKVAGGYNDVSIYSTVMTYWNAMRADLHATAGAGGPGWLWGPMWIGRWFWLLAILFAGPVAGLFGISEGRRARMQGDREQVGLIAVLVTTVLTRFAVCLRGRVDTTHLAMSAVPALVLISVFAWQWQQRRAESGQEGIRWIPHLLLGALALAGLSGSLANVRENPEEWLALRTPDRVYAELEIVRFIRQRCKPGDRIVSLPWGGLHYFFGCPAASRFTEFLPPQYGYNTPAEYAKVRVDVLQLRPKMVIFQTLGGPESIMALYPDFPLHDYRLVATIPTPSLYEALNSLCYERLAVKATH